MAVITNRNTIGTPIASGATGAQMIQLISAPRVYVKVADSLTAAPQPVIKSNGSTPAIPTGANGTAWTDLGNIKGNLKVMYQQKVKQVKTGIDNVFRAAYIQEKVGQVEGEFEQVDDVVFQQISGLTPSVVQSGSIISYQPGQTDLNILATLFVVQNKLDGKEWQFYNPAAYIQWEWAQSSDQMTLKLTGMLPFFTALGQTNQSMLTATVFA